jgi:signal transduction histidine kinase
MANDYPIPDNEPQRIEALRRYQILDSLPEQQYDDLVQLAAQITGAPIAVVSLVDEDRQWFKSIIGLDVKETRRDVAFCAHTILNTDRALIVEDACKDHRFLNNSLVTGDPHIRFYAGMPLVTEDGFALGALCVIDRVPKSLSENQIESLKCLSRLAMTLIKSNIVSEAQEKIIHDRTKEVIEAKEAVERACAQKLSIMMNISHEMRTPLHAVLNYTKLGLDRINVWDTEKHESNLMKIRKTATRLAHLIEGLLDLDQMEKIANGLDKQKTSIRHLIEMAVNDVQSIHETHHFTKLVPQAIDNLEIMADPVFLSKAISQILKNAAQYSPPKSEIELMMDFGPHSDQLLISVRDQGVGIPIGEEETIFEKFYQSSATNKSCGGAGIGLSLARAIITAHGGTIKASNNQDGGACFALSLAL